MTGLIIVRILYFHFSVLYTVYVTDMVAFKPTFLILKKYKEAYETTLLSMCPPTPIFFVFSAARVISKESRRSVFPRTSCCLLVAF
jgi:hypothetical protein